MKLFKNFLVLIFVFFFVSCSERPRRADQDLKEMNRIKNRLKRSSMLILAKKISQNYQNMLIILAEAQKTYVGMMEIHHAINTLHNEIINKQTEGLKAIDQLKEQVVVLEDILENVDWPEDTQDKVQSIKEELKQIQEALQSSQTEEPDVSADDPQGAEPGARSDGSEVPAESGGASANESEAPAESGASTDGSGGAESGTSVSDSENQAEEQGASTDESSEGAEVTPVNIDVHDVISY